MDKPRLLYVDDEPANLFLFEIAFADLYDLILAENGEEGLKMVSENQDISAVISDMKMPRMNGLEFLEEVKDINQDLRRFILTGYGLTPEIQQAIDDGIVIECFSKPFDLELIDQKIKDVLGQ